MAFQIGDRVKDYEFVDLVETTGSSETYEVFNHGEGRGEILKVLPREVQRDRRAVDRFLREAKIHARLAHPGIAEFYGGMQLAGQLVMTFEAVEGESLEERLREGPFSLEESIAICQQTLEALEYAHACTIVHRDVTPRNIVVADDGSVKLTGFELAKQATDQTLTRPGEMLGSAHYMSPEQVKGVDEIDARSDIYSLGIVLYELVAGTKPFDSKSQFDIFQAHVLQAPPAPELSREDLPHELSSAILRSLEKEPDERYPDAGSFRESLEAIAAEVSRVEEQPAGGDIRAPIDDLDFDEAGELVDISRMGLTRPAEPPEGEPDAERRRPIEQDIEAARPEAGTGRETNREAPKLGALSGWKTREWLMAGSLTALIIAVIAAMMVLIQGG